MATVTCDRRASHMLPVSNTPRQVPLRVFDTLHRRYRQGDYETWQRIAPTQKAAWSTHVTRRRS